ncbi:MAG: RNA polymerase sigma factor [Myxococcales bacterium]|nr:RNA polymerase sigma factor [Myxococcales bacterium]
MTLVALEISPNLLPWWAAAAGFRAHPGDNVARVVEERSRASVAMERHADGDAAAFAVVYDEVAPKIYRYLLRLTRNADSAADLLQQAFLKMHEARARFNRGAKVEPWAYAIAHRLFIDSTRRHRAVVPIEDQLTLASDDDTESVARAGEFSRALSVELERIPRQQREAFLLVRGEGLSIAEAAQVLGASETAVKLRAHRAYVHLREHLGEFRSEEQPE